MNRDRSYERDVQKFALDLCATWKSRQKLADLIGINRRTLADSLSRRDGMTYNSHRAMVRWMDKTAKELHAEDLPLEVEGIPIPISEDLRRHLDETARNRLVEEVADSEDDGGDAQAIPRPWRVPEPLANDPVTAVADEVYGPACYEEIWLHQAASEALRMLDDRGLDKSQQIAYQALQRRRLGAEIELIETYGMTISDDGEAWDEEGRSREVQIRREMKRKLDDQLRQYESQLQRPWEVPSDINAVPAGAGPTLFGQERWRDIVDWHRCRWALELMEAHGLERHVAYKMFEHLRDMAAIRLIETQAMTMPGHDAPWDDDRREEEVARLNDTITDRGQGLGDFKYNAPLLERFLNRLA